MKHLFSSISILLALTLVRGPLKAEEPLRHAQPLRHDLKVVLYPEELRLSVQDRITIPEGLDRTMNFLLHGGLTPAAPTPDVKIIRKRDGEGTVPLESFRVILPPGRSTFLLEYGGSIYHPLESVAKEQVRGFRQTPGVISEKGVYLSGSSFWYPKFGEGLVSFTMKVELHKAWDAVSLSTTLLINASGCLT